MDSWDMGSDGEERLPAGGVKAALWAGLAAIAGLLAVLGVFFWIAPAAAQSAVAIVETTSDVDLSRGGAVVGRVSRVGSEEARSAVGTYLKGAVSVGDGAGGPSARVQWQTLSASPDGDGEPAPGLTSDVPVQGNLLVPRGSRLSVAGDIAALIRAANRLAEGPDSSEGEDARQANTGGGQARDSASLETSTVGGGSQAQENDLANPPTLDVASTPRTTTETVATDAYGTTTDGCEPVLDEEQGVIVIMEAPTKNGEVTGPCVESLDTVPVKTSYVGCDYEVDEDAGVALATMRRYFTYGASTTYLDDDCEADPEMAFELREEAGKCRIVEDLANLEAVQETRLVFLGRKNELVVHGDCEARGGERFPITLEAEGCSLRDDFTAGVTYVRHRPTYQGPDGRVHAIGDCVDSEEFFVQEKDFSVCDALADFDEDKLYPQYRIRVPVTEPDRYRTAVCTPDANAIANLERTGTGCESLHFDYDGYSLGAKRILRTDTGDEIRGCAEADVRYEHRFEAQGWQRDDANLRALPSEAPYITLPQPAGKTFVGQARVRDGVDPAAYTLVRTFKTDTDVEFVAGSCDKYQNRDLIEVYERPDGTEYEHNAGPADPVGPSDACSPVTSVWAKTGGRGYGGGGCNCRPIYDRHGSRVIGQDCSSTVSGSYGEYTATHRRIREDGAVIYEATESREYNCGSGCGGGPSCPETAPGSASSGWMAELGWF